MPVSTSTPGTSAGTGPVVVVTDSTASLPEQAVVEHGVVVVPLQVVIGAQVLDEGAEGATPDRVAQALREYTPVSTSRPSPAVMLEAYERAHAEGASAVVSVHLSGEMSGTFESAQLAAREAPLPVTCVDTRQVGIGTGYAALPPLGSRRRGHGRGGGPGGSRPRRRDRLAVLRRHPGVPAPGRADRSGRGAARRGPGGQAAAAHRGRRVASLERVRTSARALARLEELAVEAAGEEQVDVYVAHLANPERAGALADHLRERLADNLGGRELWCGELGAVLGAHVGPGMIAVCVAPLHP